MAERTNEELADALSGMSAWHEAATKVGGFNPIREAAQRLLDMPEGERIEGCEIGSAFIRDNFAGDSVTVKLPPGGSLHKMLLEPCTLIIHTRKEGD